VPSARRLGARGNERKAPIKVLCAAGDQYKNNIGKTGGQRISMRLAGVLACGKKGKIITGLSEGLFSCFFLLKRDFGTESKKMLEML
jgi:hypothetical protein